MSWYKTASKDLKPYKIVKIFGGQESDTGFTQDAFSSEQARMFALKEHAKLNEYIEVGGDVEARIDKEEWQRRLRIKELEEEREEERIQNAWWNK